MTTTTMTQQEFLRDAMRRLKLGRDDFAVRIGCPPTTFKKWIAPADSPDNYREMPAVAWSLVREVLAHERLKDEHARLQKKIAKCS
jgi:hypothetical protein